MVFQSRHGSGMRWHRAKKSLGQHFLVDRAVLGRIIKAADISDDDTVLEIGSGRGFLTNTLLSRARNVVAVELDDSLARNLEDKYRACGNLTVVRGDARHLELSSLVPDGVAYKVVANLPYYAASPIIRRFIEAERKPKLMVVMVQREVARSMVATPGDMGILSVAIQLYGRPKVVCLVPPRAFRPVPKVTSAVVRIDVYSQPVLTFNQIGNFFGLVKAGFSTPRKQIRNSLSNGLGIPAISVETMLVSVGINPTRRAETLTLEEWGDLYGYYTQVF